MNQEWISLNKIDSLFEIHPNSGIGPENPSTREPLPSRVDFGDVQTRNQHLVTSMDFPVIAMQAVMSVNATRTGIECIQESRSEFFDDFEEGLSPND